MAKIKNNLRQPLVINIEVETGEGTGLKYDSVHFLSKEVKDVSDELLSKGEFKTHIEKGNLVVIRLG